MEQTKFDQGVVLKDKIKAINDAQNEANQAQITTPGCKLQIVVEREGMAKVIEFGAADEEARIAVCAALEQLYQLRSDLDEAFTAL